MGFRTSLDKVITSALKAAEDSPDIEQFRLDRRQLMANSAKIALIASLPSVSGCADIKTWIPRVSLEEKHNIYPFSNYGPIDGTAAAYVNFYSQESPSVNEEGNRLFEYDVLEQLADLGLRHADSHAYVGKEEDNLSLLFYEQRVLNYLSQSFLHGEDGSVHKDGLPISFIKPDDKRAYRQNVERIYAG